MSDYQWRPADGMQNAGAVPPPGYPAPFLPGPVGSKRKTWVLIGVAVLVVVLALGGVGAALLWHYFHKNQPVVLPFTGLNEAYAVAVDGAGNIYVVDSGQSRVFELPKGATTQIELPFTGLNTPRGVAVDATGNVYVADTANLRVLKLPTGTTSPVVLPFTFDGRTGPFRVAVDGSGSVYVTTDKVLKLQAGTTKQNVLPFTDVVNPDAVTVDGSGNIYVIDRPLNERLLKLPVGSTTPIELSIPPQKFTQCPSAMAVDTANNLYALCGDYRVYKLPTGSSTWTALPFDELGDNPGLAVDTAGNLYTTRGKQILKLPAG